MTLFWIILGQTPVDLYGDPLPPGAVGRLGSKRMRQGDFVFSMAFSPDGKILATAGQDRTTRLWDTATGRELYAFGEPEMIFQVAFSPKGKVFVYATRKCYSCRETESGKERKRVAFPHAEPLDLSRDGSLLAVSASKNEIGLWDTGEGRARTFACDRQISGACLSADGNVLLALDRAGGAHAWDTRTDRKIASFGTEVNDSHPRMALSGDGALLAVAIEFSKVVLWQVSTGKRLLDVRPSGLRNAGLAFSPDGRTLATSGDSGFLEEWDVASGSLKLRISGRGHGGPIAFSPDGKKIASCTPYILIHIWDAKSGEDLIRSPGHEMAVSSLAILRDSIVSGGSDRTVRAWDRATGRERLNVPYHDFVHALCATPDGRFALASGAGPAVLYDLKAGGMIAGEIAHRVIGDCVCAAMSREGKVLALSDRSGALLIQEWGTSKTLHQTAPDGGGILGLSFGRAGKLLAVAQKDLVRVLKVPSGDEIFRVPVEWARPALSPNGRMLATCSDVISLWDVPSGRKLCDAGFPKREGSFPEGGGRPVAFSPDGMEIASGSRNGPVLVYEASTGRPILTFDGDSGQVFAVAYSPDGQYLASGHENGTILVWDLACSEGAEADFDVERLWTRLADEDASVGYRAAWRLTLLARTEAGKQAREILMGIGNRAITGRIKRLIEDLDADDFITRERASNELTRIGAGHEEMLIAKSSASPEVKTRLAQILSTLKIPRANESVRRSRVIQILERLGTPEAVEVLEELREEYPQAADALERLRGR